MSDHSIIAPSSAGRWVFCTGSPSLEAQYPQEPTEATLEGEASHYIGSEVLTGLGKSENCADFIGLKLFNGVIVTDEMADAAALYVATVLSIAPHAGLIIEKQLPATAIHRECFGTPDSWYYDAKTGTLHIWDYKYGWGIVEAFENWQAICYFAAILAEIGVPDTGINVVVHVVQPRPWHPEGYDRTWAVRAEDLRPFVNKLHNSAHGALPPHGNPPQYCSGGHCRYCKGRHACVSASMSAGYAVDISRESLPVELTNDQLGIELSVLQRAYKALEYRITGLEEQGLALARQGKVIPGHKVAHGAGRAAWNKPASEVLALGDLMGVDLKKPVEPITPTQAKNKGIDKALIAAYSEHRPGKARLVPDNSNKARQIFGGS